MATSTATITIYCNDTGAVDIAVAGDEGPALKIAEHIMDEQATSGPNAKNFIGKTRQQ